MPQHKSIMNLRGEQGGAFVTDAAVEGSFACVVATTDCTLTFITMKRFTDVPTSIVLTAGQVLYGWITGATVAGTAQFFNFTDPSNAAAIKR